MPHAETDLRGSLGTVRNAVTLLHLLGEGPALQHLTDWPNVPARSRPSTGCCAPLVLADWPSGCPHLRTGSARN